MSVVLELGPGETFLFDTPGGTTTNNLPEGLKDLEAGVGAGRFFQTIYSLNFGWNGAYILAARTVNGAIIRRNNLPPQLEAWLIDPITNTCKRDIATLAVEFGPNGSFYARDKDSYRWHNLPDALEEAIQQRLCPAGWTARPDFVVLGADGAFIYSNDCGGACHALGNYPKLQELVLRLQRANVDGLTGFGLVQWVSMSIYHPGYFIALQHSGHHIAELSPCASQALNSMARTFPVRKSTSQQPQRRAVSQPMLQQPPIMQQASPLPMTHAAMPLRKPIPPPVSQPQSLPRPQLNHLVSSPIPQTHQPRPMPVHQTSAPVSQVQPVAARPASVQVPAAQAPQPDTQNTLLSASWTAAGEFASSFLNKSNEGQGANDTTSNNSYSNTTSNTNVNNNTYVVVGDPGTAPTTTYVVPGDSGVAAPAYSADSVTAPVYAAYDVTVPVYTGDSGTVPSYDVAVGDSVVYSAADDGGSVISAGDNGVASTLMASTISDTGGDTGSGFWSGLGSVISSAADSGY